MPRSKEAIDRAVKNQSEARGARGVVRLSPAADEMLEDQRGDTPRATYLAGLLEAEQKRLERRR
jgi:hypothetical protein